MAVFKPGQTTDECMVANAVLSSSLWAWFGDMSGVSYSTAARFCNLTIPKGAVILSAKVTFQSYVSMFVGTVCNIKIKGEAADNAATFSTYADYTGRAKTTANVNWNNLPVWMPTHDYDSPDVTTIIQEIVNRTGWSSGNHLVLFFEDNGSSYDAYRVFNTYLYSATYCARLTITWQSYPPITIESGSFTITGQDVTLTRGYKCDIGAGSYLLSGKSVDLLYVPIAQPTILIGGGYFNLTGQDVTLKCDRKIDAEAGSYNMTGQYVDLFKGHIAPAGWGKVATIPTIWNKR
jgi:hypothetical protein